MGERTKNTKLKRGIRKGLSILGTSIFVFVAVLFIIIIVQLFSGKEPNIFGYRFYFILTDSMSPSLDPNDVVLSKELSDAEKETIKVGDVVTFVGNSGAQNGKTLTHRVIRAPYFDEALNAVCIVTRGDKAGATDDAPTPLSDVRARMAGESVIVGFLYRGIRTPVGYALIIVVPVCVVIALLVLRLVLETKRKKSAALAAAEKAKIAEIKEKAVREYLAAQNEGKGEEKEREVGGTEGKSE